MISDFSSHGSCILQQHKEKSYEILHSSYGANRHLTYFLLRRKIIEYLIAHCVQGAGSKKSRKNEWQERTVLSAIMIRSRGNHIRCFLYLARETMSATHCLLPDMYHVLFSDCPIVVWFHYVSSYTCLVYSLCLFFALDFNHLLAEWVVCDKYSYSWYRMCRGVVGNSICRKIGALNRAIY